MKQLRIYSTPDGESQFEELGMPFSSVDYASPAASLGVTQPVCAIQYVLVKVPNNWDGGMHPALRPSSWSCHLGVTRSSPETAPVIGLNRAIYC